MYVHIMSVIVSINMFIHVHTCMHICAFKNKLIYVYVYIQETNFENSAVYLPTNHVQKKLTESVRVYVYHINKCVSLVVYDTFSGTCQTLSCRHTQLSSLECSPSVQGTPPGDEPWITTNSK